MAKQKKEYIEEINKYKYAIFNKEKYSILKIKEDEVLLEFVVDNKKIPQWVYRDCVLLVEKPKEVDIIE